MLRISLIHSFAFMNPDLGLFGKEISSNDKKQQVLAIETTPPNLM
jgi:hypothetical protein